MFQDANYSITFSKQGPTTGWVNALGNIEYGESAQTIILCWLHQVNQNKFPPAMLAVGVEFAGHTPMIGYVLKPGTIQSDQQVIAEDNVIPDFVRSRVDAVATHLSSGRQGKFTFYRRELEMAAAAEVEELSGVQIYGFLRVQS